ncbi:MAG: pyridoxamine 5'-phosphate oxidase family protein, partial [Actinobacteria bacterium]|nr:pyridoxamine 5'-phosphate oxidase family protein [Actinomycetota bacterium]
MPGYGTLPAEQGSGLLPWSWAVQQLTGSRNYWLATVGSDGQPHAMPVWGAWLDGALWFSSGWRSRKVRNLAHQPRCALATQDSEQPVQLQGFAEVVRDPTSIAAFLDASNLKYGTEIGIDFLDPDVNATIRVPPRVVIALREA